MLKALGNLVYTCILIWIENLLVYAKDFEELLQALEKVFER